MSDKPRLLSKPLTKQERHSYTSILLALVLILFLEYTIGCESLEKEQRQQSTIAKWEEIELLIKDNPELIKDNPEVEDLVNVCKAIVFIKDNDYSKALPYLEKSYELRKIRHGNHNPKTLEMSHLLGVTYFRLDMNKKAESLFLINLKVASDLDGPDSEIAQSSAHMLMHLYEGPLSDSKKVIEYKAMKTTDWCNRE